MIERKTTKCDGQREYVHAPENSHTALAKCIISRKVMMPSRTSAGQTPGSPAVRLTVYLIESLGHGHEPRYAKLCLDTQVVS